MRKNLEFILSLWKVHLTGVIAAAGLIPVSCSETHAYFLFTLEQWLLNRTEAKAGWKHASQPRLAGWLRAETESSSGGFPALISFALVRSTKAALTQGALSSLQAIKPLCFYFEWITVVSLFFPTACRFSLSEAGDRQLSLSACVVSERKHCVKTTVEKKQTIMAWRFLFLMPPLLKAVDVDGDQLDKFGT